VSKIVNDTPDLIRLTLPLSGFETLHDSVAKVRSTSKSVSVNVEALRALLSDHSVCLTALKGRTREP
jgi:hypothetical protein